MKRPFLRWLDTTGGRLSFVVVCIWVTLMLVGLIQFATGGGWWGFLMATGLSLYLAALIYLVPRVSNWVQYRKWSGRSDLFREEDDQ